MNEESVATWHVEHERFSRLLDMLDDQLRVLATGAKPDYALASDIVAYLQDFGDVFHHPREDAVFIRLRAKNHEMAEPIDRVTQGHRVLAVAGTDLRSMLQAAINEEPYLQGKLEAILALYILYYREHIAFEEKNILANTAGILSNEDWNALAHVFVSKAGDATIEESGSRFSRIVGRRPTMSNAP